MNNDRVFTRRPRVSKADYGYRVTFWDGVTMPFATWERAVSFAGRCSV